MKAEKAEKPRPGREGITRALTRAALTSAFMLVMGFSLLLSPELTWGHIAVAFLKACLAVAFGWIFFSAISDAVVKSISDAARNEEEDTGPPVLELFREKPRIQLSKDAQGQPEKVEA